MAESRRKPQGETKPEDQVETTTDTTEEAGTETEAASNGKVQKKPAEYHIYTTEDEGSTLTWLQDIVSKTADSAAKEVVKGDESLVDRTLVVVPSRNLKTFTSEVETRTKVKVSAA
jgi:hypothetical protein